MTGARPSPLINARAMALAGRFLGPRVAATEIRGDASTRRFVRVSASGRTAVLIIHAGALEPSSPFYSNHHVLESIGAPVPRLIDRDDPSGLVLVEDLGDTTLREFLSGGAGASPEPSVDKRDLYRQACDLIVLLHERGASALRPDDFAARNALDLERFRFEFDHFHRHFLLGVRGVRPDRFEETVLRDFFAEVATVCHDQRRVYCHRDFQSRNLMVQKGRLRLIDFQDARLGPYTYDAASLLRDSSLDLEEGLVQELLDYLAGRLREAPDEFRRDFDLMALQRNIKDLGTFAYMATVRGRRDYLDYVPRTLDSIRRTLVRERRFHAAYPVLDKLILNPSPCR